MKLIALGSILFAVVACGRDRLPLPTRPSDPGPPPTSGGPGPLLPCSTMTATGFTLSGTVRDSSNRPLDGVSISAVGAACVSRVKTGIDGTYNIPDLSGTIRVLAGKPEFFPLEVQMVSMTANQTLNFTLRPMPNLRRSYSLIWRASTRCAASLPEAVQRRVYTAEIVQFGGTIFEARLAGGSFIIYSNLFGNLMPGSILDEKTVSFHLQSGQDGFDILRDLVERVAPNVFLEITGRGRGTLEGSTIEGTLDGDFTVYAEPPPANVYDSGSAPVAACTAPDHHWTFTRR